MNYARGIWVLWNNSQISLSHIQISNRCVHATVTTNQGMPHFLMSAVYNYPQTHLQPQVWSELNSIASTVNNNKWLVIGDFNCILDENEQKGGRKPLL